VALLVDYFVDGMSCIAACAKCVATAGQHDTSDIRVELGGG
jgi:hypothetical protein